MTTGRINQVTDETRRGGKPIRPLPLPTVPFHEGNRPPAGGRPERLRRLSTLGRESHQTPYGCTKPDSPPSRQHTSWPPGVAKTPSLRRLGRLQATTGPGCSLRARNRRTQTTLRPTALPHQRGATTCIRTETPRTQESDETDDSHPAPKCRGKPYTLHRRWQTAAGQCNRAYSGHGQPDLAHRRHPSRTERQQTDGRCLHDRAKLGSCRELCKTIFCKPPPPHHPI